MRRTKVSGSRADLLVPLAQRVDRDHPFPVCRRAWRERGLARRGRTRVTCRIREKKLRVSNPTRLLPTCVDAVPLRARCRGRQVVICRSGAIGAPQGATSSEQRVVICQSSAKGAPRGASSSEQRVVVCQSRRCACRRVPASPRSSLTWSSLQCSCRTQLPQTASRRVGLEG